MPASKRQYTLFARSISNQSHDSKALSAAWAEALETGNRKGCANLFNCTAILGSNKRSCPWPCVTEAALRCHKAGSFCCCLRQSDPENGRHEGCDGWEQCLGGPRGNLDVFVATSHVQTQDHSLERSLLAREEFTQFAAYAHRFTCRQCARK